MTRPERYEYQSANGYWYRKVDGAWKAIHHIIAEEKLGRPLSKDERVGFVDRDRNNLHPDNIVVRSKKLGREKRIQAIKARIALLQEELADLESR